MIAGWSLEKKNAPGIRSTPSSETFVRDLMSDFFWEAQILATCCRSTAVLTEILCAPDKHLVLLLCHVVTKLTEMSLVPLMRYF